MLQVTRDYVDVGGGKMYYEIAGQGETVVFGHAGFVDSRMWDDQWQEFARQYRVLRYDMRGYGKSDVVAGPVSRRQDTYTLLQALGISRAVLIGCSMSGQVMLDLALEHPELASALVVVSATPSGFQLQGAPPRYLMDMVAASQQGDTDRASELQIRIWVDGPFREPEQVNRAVRQRAAEMNHITVANGTWAKADMQPVNPLNPPAVERLGKVKAPTLVIAGALDDPEILRAADVMTAGISGAQKVILPDAAHVPNMEAPGTFNEAVLSFLHSLK
jgi:2-hydroxy-6-oxonona-2,4-dienedioate hydrolase